MGRTVRQPADGRTLAAGGAGGGELAMLHLPTDVKMPLPDYEIVSSVVPH
jgi:hypothetical protein